MPAFAQTLFVNFQPDESTEWCLEKFSVESSDVYRQRVHQPTKNAHLYAPIDDSVQGDL
jgi:hypothetical protein